MKKKQNNYLDKIPCHNPKYKWDQNDKDEVTIYIENTGPFNFAAQKLLKKPRISQVHLDGVGNYVWPLIDGKRSVYEIGIILKERLGEKAEPLYPRLVKFMQILEANGFITF